jgi:type IV pilus assembly protein PilY1
MCGIAVAGTADISNTPVTAATSSVRTNLMLILDDSGSMADDYMPDNVNSLSGTAALCFGYSGVNKIFFDPNASYPLPVASTGLPLATPTWPNAWVDGYATSKTNKNLTNAPTWANASSNNTNNTFYYVTADTTGTSVTCPDGQSYKLTAVTTLPAALQTKYMIWYSYYRTRILMTRGAVGLVMADIDASRFRVGLSAISGTGTSDGSTFLNVRDFDQTSPINQKNTFYSTLYALTPGGYTPLRPALEKVGKYFANKTLAGVALPSGRDPVQYSCQRNYAIMTTDGYWNTSSESSYRSSYVPTQLNGSTQIGNQDSWANSTPRPMLDDGRYQGGNWVTGSSGGGVINSLADIARYFYTTDLRDSSLGNCTGAVANQNVCVNNVPSVGNDTSNFQHMSLFTMGLGLAGKLTYRPDYETATTGDFYAIKQGTKAWPNPTGTTSTTSYSTSSTVLERVDDLWHAAVNAGGTFYSASTPGDVVDGLKNALSKLNAVTGAGSSAATSTLQPVAGDNAVYLGLYTTAVWTGNLLALSVDPYTGTVSSTPSWQAAQTLAAQVGDSSDSRNIYFFDSTATNKLRSFTYANLSSAGKGSYFQNICSKSPVPFQCSDLALMGGTVLADANNGTNLVNYLRGQRGKENSPTNVATSQLYRFRQAPANPPLQPSALQTPLGDLINATPVFVGKPPFKYTDAGYNTFASSMAGRTKVIYAASNDGMLHAFNAATGAELWAYVPTAVMPNMYRLADFNYPHLYYVDGSPVVGDVFDGTNWRTILVGGLGGGGRAYYALDITDPANPIALWEFSVGNDANLGLTYGNPVIAKNKAGTWVVMFSSGYNNVSPGDGNGYLYTLNAVTGAQINAPIPTYTSGTTPAGNTTTPSNLGRIDAWVDSDTSNIAKRVYGADMLGYVWRFDFDDNIAPSGRESFLLARALTSGGVAQPITTRPMLTSIKVNNVSYDLVTIATGRLLGTSDVGDTTTQSVYVFKDPLSSTSLGTLRNNAGMVAQPLQEVVVNGVTKRTNTTLNPVNWATQEGWYVDLSLTAGERVNVDPLQAGNLMVFASNIPTSDVCTPGGSSWEYFFDITKGSLVKTILGDSMTVGISLIKIKTTDTDPNSGEPAFLNVNNRGQIRTDLCEDCAPGGILGTARRITWRELVQ